MEKKEVRLHCLLSHFTERLKRALGQYKTLVAKRLKKRDDLVRMIAESFRPLSQHLSEDHRLDGFQHSLAAAKYWEFTTLDVTFDQAWFDARSINKIVESLYGADKLLRRAKFGP